MIKPGVRCTYLSLFAIWEVWLPVVLYEHCELIEKGLNTTNVLFPDPRRKQLLRLKLTTADSSLDVRDPAVMESILTWVIANFVHRYSRYAVVRVHVWHCS